VGVGERVLSEGHKKSKGARGLPVRIASTYGLGSCRREARVKAFTHWFILSRVSAAKWYVLMFACSALKANFLLILSSGLQTVTR
jgi:hypothetical protein